MVNNSRGKGLADWTEMMRSAMEECQLVLKPGRWLSLCYHDSSLAMWGQIQKIMEDSGFQIGNSRTPLYIDTGSATYNQRVTQKAVKRDLVMNFRKNLHKSCLRKSQTNKADFDMVVRRTIREYLRDNPGASKDKIYDQLINALMRETYIQDINFERVLREVAFRTGQSENSWFLKGSREPDGPIS